MRRYVRVLLALCLGLSTAAWAEDYTWISNSGDWSELLNWQLGDGSTPTVLPGATDNVTFSRPDIGGNTDITVDVDPTVANLTIGGGARWHFNQDSDGSTVTVSGTADCGDVGYLSQFQPVLTGGASLDFHSTTAGGWSYGLNFSNAGNSYTGQTIVQSGYIAMTSIGTGTVRVEGGNLLQLATWDTDITLAGGAYGMPSEWPFSVSGLTNAGDLTLEADATLFTSNNFDRDWTLSGTISGPGKLTYDARRTGPSDGSKLTLSGVNDFSGGLEVVSGRLYATVYEALGTGTVHVRAGATNAGGLAIMADPVPVEGEKPATIIAEPGGWVVPQQTGSDMTFPLILNGGTLMGPGIHYSDWGNATHNSADPVALTADSFLGNGESGSTLTVKSQIVEQGGSFSLTKNLGTGLVVLDNADNQYSGGTYVTMGTLRADQPGALGTGPVLAKGGTLWTHSDGCLDSVDSVMIDEGGAINLDSNETAVIQVLPGGTFEISGGCSTTPDYTPAGNIQLSAGCVLGDLNGNPEPTLTDFLPGDGGHGAFIMGTGDVTVGGTSIYRGLAVAPNRNLIYSGTVDEASGGTGGVAFLAMSGATWTYDNARLLPQSGNTIKFYGAGTHRLNATTVYGGNLEMEGPGTIQINQGNALAAGLTLDVNNGHLDLNDPDALAGATVNINAGAGFIADLTPSSLGTFTVNSGGAIDAWNGDHNDYLAGLSFTMEKNSQYMLRWYGMMDGAGDLPGAGMADYIHYFGGNVTGNTLGDRVMRLANDTRLTTWWTGGTNDGKFNPVLDDHTYGSPPRTGVIALAPDATQARITCPSGMPSPSEFLIEATINLTGSGGAAGTIGTLVIGDPNDFDVFGRAQGNFTTVSQDGSVYLGYGNNNNVIGAIDVQAGRLHVNDMVQMGGAEAVHVADGATFRADQNVSTAAVFGGDGTVDMGGGSMTLTLSPAEGVAAGFAASGVLDVDANVSLMAYAGTTPSNPSVAVKVTEASRTATVASQVAVSGNVVSDQLDVNVLLGVPSANLNPAMMADMPILTGASVTTGTVNVVMGETIGVPGDNHWNLKAGEVGYDATSGVDLVLVGASIEWTAVPGNANLDGMVGIADLVALAEHYGDTDVDWMDGDFNLDGVVGIADLVALAEHYGDVDAGVGGGTVPEPMTLVLLGVGGAALLRRRRR